MSNARRFGGTFSKGGATPTAPASGSGPDWRNRAIRSPSLRVLLLSLAPSALLLGMPFALLRDDAVGLIWLGAAYAAFLAGAALTRVGQQAAAAYAAHAVARPPAWPRKLIGGALIAIGVALCSLRGTGSITSAALFGAIALGLHVIAFGIDPLRAKGVDGLDAAALDAAITRVETGRALIAEMQRAATRFGDRALEGRVAQLANTATEVLAKIEQDPRDLTRSRRFLAVYLVGARDATVQYAETFDSSGAPEIREKYVTLLDDLETHFTRHRETLTSADVTMLDVEIEVLRDRLRADGV